MQTSNRANWRVPMLDPSRVCTALENQLNEAFARVLRGGCYILGPEVANFEREVCAYLGVKDCIGVSSGTDALLTTLMAAGIGPGDEVITSPLTFVATAEAILRVKATPVFVDLCPFCLCLDPSCVAGAVGTQTKAILAVDLYGQLGHIEQLRVLAQGAGIILLEDACQAFGAKIKGRAAGTFGNAGCFSFFPSKPLGGFGDAGLVATDNLDLAESVRALRTHGSRNKHTYSILGGNFRMDALQASLLRVMLSYMDEWLISRRELASTYSKLLTNLPFIRTPEICGPADSAWSVYTLRVPRHRDALKAYLADSGIETAIYYPTTLARQPLFAAHSRVHGELTVAEEATQTVLSLPLFPGLQMHDQTHVVESIGRFLATLNPNELGLLNSASGATGRQDPSDCVNIGP